MPSPPFLLLPSLLLRCLSSPVSVPAVIMLKAFSELSHTPTLYTPPSPPSPPLDHFHSPSLLVQMNFIVLVLCKNHLMLP